MATDGQTLCDDSTGAAALQILGSIGQAAAFVGAKRNDFLAGQIVMLQEREDTHGGRAAPAGIADKNGLIGCHVIHKTFDFGGYKLSSSKIKRLNAVMQTCGFYDEAGEFSYLVGLPGKSGVGGGIVAVHPLHYSVAVWSPRLNSKGNSVMGMKALELLTTYTEESIF